MAERQDNYISLIAEDGCEVPFELLDVIEYEGEKYVILLPQEEGADEVVILKAGTDESGTESYDSIEDEETLETVFDIFKARFSDTFTFGD